MRVCPTMICRRPLTNEDDNLSTTEKRIIRVKMHARIPNSFLLANFYATVAADKNCNDIFIPIFRESIDMRRRLFVKVY